MIKIVLLCVSCFSAFLYAQAHTIPVMQKALTCQACHGAQGISLNPQWPNLAGQNQKYLHKQLQDFREKTHRESPLMFAAIAGLSPEDQEQLSAYYAQMPVTIKTLAKTNIKTNTKIDLKRGEALYKRGDFTQHIPACIACHGPAGTGNAQAGFPAVASQHAEYTIVQLQAFKQGRRTNDLNHIMQDICSKMSQEDMQAVAQYIEDLPGA